MTTHRISAKEYSAQRNGGQVSGSTGVRMPAVSVPSLVAPRVEIAPPCEQVSLAAPSPLKLAPASKLSALAGKAAPTKVVSAKAAPSTLEEWNEQISLVAPFPLEVAPAPKPSAPAAKVASAKIASAKVASAKVASTGYLSPQDVQGKYITFNPPGFQQSKSKEEVPLVSLGCACGPKMAFEEIGRGAEGLPFDWLTTTHAGVLKFLRSGFEGFFDFETKAQKTYEKITITAFRSKEHGFWHDDPTDGATREKYNRRFARMLAIDARTSPVLFVRLAATTDEISTVSEMMGQLLSQFGPQAYLLLIIDCQGENAPGPCTVKGCRNLIIDYITAGDGISKFCAPVDNALGYAAGQPTKLRVLEDLAVAANLAMPKNPGYYGMAGMPAFEGIPESC